MNKLDNLDLSFAVIKLPKVLKAILKNDTWAGRVYVGGGYVRAVITREDINDIDLFVQTKETATALAEEFRKLGGQLYPTNNAITITGLSHIPIQIIHRWVFEKPEDVANSFDFTICCSVFWYQKNGGWQSFVDPRFYQDLAAKRLVYRSPVRNEEAGGSMLRVLKYYQRGYRIPLDSLGAVIARLVNGVDRERANSEEAIASVVTGLLRVVDPAIDPTHEAHLPAMKNEIEPETEETIGGKNLAQIIAEHDAGRVNRNNY